MRTHCAHCGQPLIDRRPIADYCSDVCRWRAFRRRRRAGAEGLRERVAEIDAAA